MADPKSNTSENKQLKQSAIALTNHACTLSMQHIQDGMLRLQFNREVSYYAQGVVRDVEGGRKSAAEGVKALEDERDGLEKSTDALLQSVGLAAGVLQVTGGVVMCVGSYGVGCGLGILTAAHGLNNIYENGTNLLEARTDSKGYVREFHHFVWKSYGGTELEGNMTYGALDLGLSGYGAFRKVLKPGAWRLYKYVETDYIRAYKTLNNRALMFDRSADAATGIGTYKEWRKSNE